MRFLTAVIVLSVVFGFSADATSATSSLGTWTWPTFELREQMASAYVTLYAGPSFSGANFTGTGEFDPLSPSSFTIESGIGNYDKFEAQLTLDNPSIMSVRWIWGQLPGNFCCVGSPQLTEIVEPFGNVEGYTIERIEFTWTPTKAPGGGNPGWAVGQLEVFGTVPEPSTALLLSMGLVAMSASRRRLKTVSPMCRN